MTELLKYHVVAGYDLAPAISDGKQRATLDDQTLTFTVTGTTVKIDSKATVTAPNQFANNGVVHVIDAILIPPVWTDFAPTNEAFKAVPATLLSRLLSPVGVTTLQSLLEYHVVNGKVSSSDLSMTKLSQL